MKRTIILASISVLCLLQTGWGQVPRTISYQGVLKDDAGNLINDSVNLTFSIYAVASEGTALWSELHSATTVTDGVFSVTLGSSDLLGLDFDVQYWLEIAVNGVPLSTRTQLTASPYSFHALQADTSQYALSTPMGGEAWSLTGNNGTTAGTNFLGTSDDMALELHVNNTRALRLEPNTNSPNVIGGHSSNSVTGGYGATIGGGGASGMINQVTQAYGTIGGGINNTASNISATVSGGGSNTASGVNATVGGGANNTASGVNATVGGGTNNTANEWATVGGGASNTASGVNATVGGGTNNTASGQYTTIGGGDANTASGYAAAVPGGYLNVAAGGYSFAAGQQAKANHDGAFVWADGTNADFASTAANQFLIRAAGGVGIGTANPATALEVNGTVTASAFSGSGSTALDFQVNSARALRLEPHATSPNVIGGFLGNNVSSGVFGATIGGGGYSVYVNQVTANYGTVGGGQGNTASGAYAAVGGGHGNTASGGWVTIGGGNSNTADGTTATVAGGVLNTASGVDATVGGGTNNNASGWYATVPGGSYNTASGQYSFAAGRRAKAVHDGAFVWADQTDADFASTAVNQFLIRAAGVGIGTASPDELLTVAGTVQSTSGGFKFPDGSVQATAASGGVTDHGALTGLGDDDHPQYLLESGGTLTGNVLANVGVTVDGVDISAHSTDADAHHSRYTNTEAVAAMGTKADTNPLHHDKTTSASELTSGTLSESILPQNAIDGTEIEDNSLTAADMATNILSSIDGVTNDGGNVDLVAGSNITITPSDAANTITIAASPTVSPAGSDGQVQYNNGGSLGGAGVLYYDDINSRVGIGTSTPGEKLHVAGNVRLDANGEIKFGGDFTRMFGDGSQNLWIEATDQSASGMTIEANGAVYIMSNNNDVEVEGNWFLVNVYDGIELNANVGIDGNNASYKLYVNGSAAGTTVWNNLSDLRYKDNIETLPNALEELGKIRGVSFQWNDLTDAHGHEAGESDIGVIAQEIEQIYPEMVVTDSEGYKSVGYAKFTVVLIEAVKELKAEKDALEERVNTELAALRAENSEMKAQMIRFESMLQRLEVLTANMEKDDGGGTTVAEVQE